MKLSFGIQKSLPTVGDANPVINAWGAYATMVLAALGLQVEGEAEYIDHFENNALTRLWFSGSARAFTAACDFLLLESNSGSLLATLSGDCDKDTFDSFKQALKGMDGLDDLEQWKNSNGSTTINGNVYVTDKAEFMRVLQAYAMHVA